MGPMKTNHSDSSQLFHVTQLNMYSKMWTYLVHKACGMISPKKRTAVTEMATAATGFVIRSMNIGIASTAPALLRSKVTSKR